MREKALLVVSFGTSYAKTRRETIEAVEGKLQEAFPARAFYRAWTSRCIVRKLKREGHSIDTLEESLERILQDGKRDLLIQPTYIMQGKEYQAMLEEVEKYRTCFESIRVGEPLLSSEEDLSYLAEVLPKIFPEVKGNEQLILMGHGTPGGDNSCYHRMNALFLEKGYRNFQIGLVEAKPGITELIGKMKEVPPTKVYLVPFMLVAGAHAAKDMAGDSEDSWQHLLEREGYQVECRMQGLGEYSQVRKLFETHAKQAGRWRLAWSEDRTYGKLAQPGY